MSNSKGHQATIGDFEYFIRNGELFRARITIPVMPDGYRSGRWCCPERMAAEWITMIKESILA